MRATESAPPRLDSGFEQWMGARRRLNARGLGKRLGEWPVDAYDRRGPITAGAGSHLPLHRFCVECIADKQAITEGRLPGGVRLGLAQAKHNMAQSRPRSLPFIVKASADVIGVQTPQAQNGVRRATCPLLM